MSDKMPKKITPLPLSLLLTVYFLLSTGPAHSEKKPPANIAEYPPCSTSYKCPEGQKCWEIDGKNLCLPDDSSQCPAPTLECIPPDGNCKLVCYQTKGFGCQSIPSKAPRPFEGILTIILGILTLPLLLFKRLKSPARK